MNTSLRSLVGMTLAAGLASAVLAADLKVGFVTSLSGPGSSIGIPYAKGIQAAAAYKPEVGGRKIQLIQLDDASDPSTAARNARKLIDEEKVDVLIGTSGVPGSMAIAAVARESKTPMIGITPLSFPGEEGARRAAQVAEHMLTNGVYVIAFSYPVVPIGKARIRVQLSAAHTEDDVRQCVSAFVAAREAVG